MLMYFRSDYCCLVSKWLTHSFINYYADFRFISSILVATDGMSIVYTKFIDPYSIQILCTTTDSSIPLDDIRWNISTQNNNNENPLLPRNLNNTNYILNCNGGTSSLSFNVNLLIQGMSRLYRIVLKTNIT